MRILKLKLKNLNSLAGEWTIDFTHADFVSSGLFALLGPTGAGKSTILDAVCLGLYRRTPRIPSISNETNEVMTRGTGDCYAEVTIETSAGIYRCHWSQRRARGQAAGKLRDARHEISRADTGDIVATGLKNAFVQEITGMSYSQFTKAILLAQGDFAAFLKAPANDRSPILEQITGTEIYGQISEHVHELTSAARQKLQLFETELKGTRVLADEEVADIKAKLVSLEEDLGRRRSDLERADAAIAWLQSIANLEGDLTRLEEAEKDWQRRNTAFAPERERLLRASRALELAADHTALLKLREDQQRDQTTLKQLEEAATGVQGELAHAAAKLTEAKTNVDASKDAQAQGQRLITEVRAIDVRIESVNAALGVAQEKLLATQGERAQTEGQLNELKASLHRDQTRMSALAQELDSTAIDEKLIASAAGLGILLSHLAEKQQNTHQKSTRLPGLKSAWNEAQSGQTAQEELLLASKQRLTEALAERTKEVGALTTLLEGKELAHWRKLSLDSRASLRLFEDLGQVVASVAKSKNRLTQHAARAAVLREKNTELTNSASALKVTLSEAERIVSLLQANHLLRQKVMSLEEARQQLQDDRPCPLCGALDHPFAAGVPPNIADADRELSEALGKVKSQEKKLQELRFEQAQIESELGQIAARERDDQTDLTELLRRKNHLLVQLDIDGDVNEEQLRSLGEQAISVQRQVDAKVSDAEALEQQIKQLDQTQQQLDEQVRKATSGLEAQRYKVETAATAVDTAETDLQVSKQELGAKLNECVGALNSYQITLDTEDIEKTLRTINERKAKREERNTEKINLERRLDAQKLSLSHAEESLAKATAAITQMQSELALMQDELSKLFGARRQIFGDKNPDREETALAQAHRDAERILERASVSHHELDIRLKNHLSQAHTLRQGITERTNSLAEAQAAFGPKLLAQGFRDEDDLSQAKLPEQSRTTLAEAAKELQNERVDIDASVRDRREKLIFERNRKLTEESLASLRERRPDLEAAIARLNEERGAHRQRLADNDQVSALYQSKRNEIIAQQREVKRWADLDALIGSAKGAKFRNFAQGLTFERLIQYANRELCKMTDRYLLVRSTSANLDFSVVDGYQAGEIRTIKNLSGGETFLVSMALALGLSKMASRKMRVDSLFMDEGFGSLDPDTLEVALDAIAGLKHEGKLIGVISHVPGLKDRIDTQIRVMRKSGGRSVIEGPGCSRGPEHP